MECPINNCKRVQQAEIRYAELWQKNAELLQKNVELEEKCEKLKEVPGLFAGIFQLFQEGYQVIGIEENCGTFYAVVMEPYAPDPTSQTIFDDRSIYLYQLPYTSTAVSFGCIDIAIRECCNVFIEDICVDAFNKGYGSILLKNVILFLQRAGFRTLTGKISPVDGGHLDRLVHFYRKFGFQVAVKGTQGSIRLNLQKHEFPTIETEDVVACCRGSGYSKVRSEHLLAHSKEKQND